MKLIDCFILILAFFVGTVIVMGPLVVVDYVEYFQQFSYDQKFFMAISASILLTPVGLVIFKWILNKL